MIDDMRCRWITAGWGHISIDRSNLTKAIASLKRAVNAIYKWGRCVAVSLLHSFIRSFIHYIQRTM
jgi:hypothetical protein